MLEKDVFLHGIFAGTTVDISRIHAFFDDESESAAVSRTTSTVKWHEEIEYLDIILRMYLRKKCVPFYIVEQIDSFLEFGPKNASLLIQEYLGQFEQNLLNEEWYELMTHFEFIRRKIRRRFGI